MTHVGASLLLPRTRPFALRERRRPSRAVVIDFCYDRSGQVQVAGGYMTAN